MPHMSAIPRLLALCIFAPALASLHGCGGGRPPAPGAAPAAAQSAEELQAEIEALRLENQQLRRELVAKNPKPQGTAVPVKAGDTGPERVVNAPDTGYWMSSGSHIRHNPRCRNYRKVKGYPCGPDDGKPCRNCGG